MRAETKNKFSGMKQLRVCYRCHFTDKGQVTLGYRNDGGGKHRSCRIQKPVCKSGFSWYFSSAAATDTGE